MSAFFRVIRSAFQYRLAIVGIVLTSIVVGLCWGANLGVVYPLVNVVLKGDSLQSWLGEEVTKAEKKVAEVKESAGEDSFAMDIAKTRLSLVRWGHGHTENLIPQGPFAALAAIMLVLVAGTIIKQVFLVTNIVLVGRVVHRTTRKLREDLYSRAISMHMGSFGKDQSSDLISRMTHDVQQVNEGMETIFGVLVREPCKVAACLAGAAFVNWRLLLLCMIVAPAAGFLMVTLARSLKRANRRAMQEMSEIYGKLADSLGGVETVQAYTSETFERNRFKESTITLYRRYIKIVFYSALTKPTTELMGVGIMCLAMLAGGYLVVNQQTTLFGITVASEPMGPSAMLLFFAFIAGLSDPARKVSQIVNKVQRGAAGAERVFAMYDRLPEIVSPEKPVPLPPASHAIKFENVTFAYETEPVLHNLNLEIKAGEVVALVGPNGCGKSTLLRMIERFYDADQGHVKISGVDVRDVDLKALRQQMSWVAQKAVIFELSIADNIAYGCESATREQIIAAAKEAHADEFIEKKENGYDTMLVEKGRNVSGGQAQRIALARAILRDAPIVLLDEATSQIDRQSEVLIHEALATFVQGRTTVMVTHRLSTLELADRIVVMEKGTVVDSGKHHELLARCPAYRKLQQGELKESA